MEVFVYNPAAEPLVAFNARLADYCARANVSGITGTPLGRGVLLSLVLLEEIPAGCVLTAELTCLTSTPNKEQFLGERIAALASTGYAPVEATSIEPLAGEDQFVLIKSVRAVVTEEAP